MKTIQKRTDGTYELFDESSTGCQCINFTNGDKKCTSNCPLFDAVELPDETGQINMKYCRVTLRCGIATSAIFEQEIELPF